MGNALVVPLVKRIGDALLNAGIWLIVRMYTLNNDESRWWLCRELSETQSDARNVEISLKVNLSMISSFAAAAHAPWTAATITFADAEIVRIGKSCPKRKKWKTTMHWLDPVLRKLVVPGYHLSSFAMPPRIAQGCHRHKKEPLSMDANRSKNCLGI